MTSYDDWQKERTQLLEEIRRLKEENASLKKKIGVIDEHRCKEKQGLQTDSAMRRLSPQEKVLCFAVFSVVVMTCLLGVGSAMSVVKAVINQYAQGNGIRNTATR